MADERQYKELYNAIERRAPVAEITSLAVDERMFSAKKWRYPYYGVNSTTLFLPLPACDYPAKHRGDCGSAFHCASYFNHVDLVEELISHRSACVNQQTDEFAMSALQIACAKGRTHIVRALLDSGADVNFTDFYARSALHLASRNGNADIVCDLLHQGADINCMDYDRVMALDYAVMFGNAEVVRCLLLNGADVNHTNKAGRSALFFSSHYGYSEILQALLDKGADVHRKDFNCQTALHSASYWGRVEAVKSLLAHGADINGVDKLGDTPLHMTSYSTTADDCVHIPVAMLLLKHGANPTAKNHDGDTPAVCAVTNARQQVIKAAEADYNLTHFEKGKPKVVRLAVLGDEAVGKTQFISTVRSSAIKVFVRSLRKLPSEGSRKYVAQRTPGVQVKEICLSDDRLVRVLDMGGQPQFIASHRPLIVTGFGMYLLVLNLLVGFEGMLKSARHWLAFVIATRHPAMFQGCQPPPLLILFSHADLMAGHDPRHLASEVYACIKDEYSEYFNWMSCRPYVGNCRARSSEINRLLADLDEAHELVAKAMPLEPLINNRIRQALKSRNNSHGPCSAILKLDDFYSFVRQHVSGLQDKDLASLTTLLDMQADVMLFDCQETGQETGQEVTSPYVVVDPYHVCHHMLKAILSPRQFKGSHLVFPSNGVIEGPKLDNALIDAGIDPKAGKGLLHYAKICTLYPQPPERHFFAVHVVATSGTWKEDGITKPKLGVQLHCAKIPVSPAFLPALQLELSNVTGGISEETIIWKTGIVVPWKEKVIVMVQQVEGGFGVNITARAKPDRQGDCVVALAGVSNLTLCTAKSVSPGSQTELRYLSPSQVSAGQQLTIAYTAEKIVRHLMEKRMLIHGDGTDDPDDVIPLVRATQPHICPREEGSTGLPYKLEHHPQIENAHYACSLAGNGHEELSTDEVDIGMPGCTSGRALNDDDPELFDVCDQLALDMHELKRFGAHLLEGSGCKLSSDAFLASLNIYEYTSVPSRAHALLKYWIQSAPGPLYMRHGGQLRTVMERIGKHAVALSFRTYLG